MAKRDVKCPDCRGKAKPITDGKGREGFDLYGFKYSWFCCPKCKKNFIIKFPKS